MGSPDELAAEPPATEAVVPSIDDARMQDIPLTVLDAEEAKKELLGH